jgi:hypothetical protein
MAPGMKTAPPRLLFSLPIAAFERSGAQSPRSSCRPKHQAPDSLALVWTERDWREFNMSCSTVQMDLRVNPAATHRAGEDQLAHRDRRLELEQSRHRHRHE